MHTPTHENTYLNVIYRMFFYGEYLTKYVRQWFQLDFLQ
jgi:hypothetical protein